jgi:hypothetical protein
VNHQLDKRFFGFRIGLLDTAMRMEQVRHHSQQYDGNYPTLLWLLIDAYFTSRNLGIGVDTHVHRIANRLGWIKTEKDGPEATREVQQDSLIGSVSFSY